MAAQMSSQMYEEEVLCTSKRIEVASEPACLPDHVHRSPAIYQLLRQSVLR